MNSDPAQETTGPRYPECHVTLLGTSANVYSIVGKVRRALGRHLRESGSTREEAETLVEEFTDEAMSGDYDNALTTAFRWVDVN